MKAGLGDDCKIVIILHNALEYLYNILVNALSFPGDSSFEHKYNEIRGTLVKCEFHRSFIKPLSTWQILHFIVHGLVWRNASRKSFSRHHCRTRCLARRKHPVCDSNKQLCQTKVGRLKQPLVPSTWMSSDFFKISPTSVYIPLSVCNLSPLSPLLFFHHNCIPLYFLNQALFQER